MKVFLLIYIIINVLIVLPELSFADYDARAHIPLPDVGHKFETVFHYSHDIKSGHRSRDRNLWHEGSIYFLNNITIKNL